MGDTAVKGEGTVGSAPGPVGIIEERTTGTITAGGGTEEIGTGVPAIAALEEGNIGADRGLALGALGIAGPTSVAAAAAPKREERGNTTIIAAARPLLTGGAAVPRLEELAGIMKTGEREMITVRTGDIAPRGGTGKKGGRYFSVE